MNKYHPYVASFLVVCCLLCFVQNRAIQTFYLDDQCKSSQPQTITYRIGSPADKDNSSGILKASRLSTFPPLMNCTVQLIPSGTSGVVLSVKNIDFRMFGTDQITLVDASGTLQTLSDHMWSSNEVWSYYTNGAMILKVRSGYGPLQGIQGGFELIFTSFRSSPCLSRDFKCKNGRCIWKGLKCDGHNHCGDNSDQVCGISFSGIVGAVFGCIFLVIAIVAGFIYCRRRRRTVVTTTFVPGYGTR